MEKVRIDIVPMGVTPNAHASQYDVARVIRFLLYNQGTAYTLAGTETITVKMTKPDGTEETVSVTNTSSDYVDFVTTDGLLDQAGLYPCEISIVNGTDVIGSKNFNLRVEMDPYNGKGLRVVTVGPADICTFEPTISEPLVNVKCELTPSLDGYSAVNLTACGVNLIDISDLATTGITYSSGDLSGTAGAFNTAYDNGYASGHAFNANTQYTVSMKAYTEGNASTSGNGLRFGFIYTDGTKSYETVVNSVTTATAVNCVSTSGKTVKAIYFTYGSASNNIWHISDLMLESGTSASAYHAYTGNAYAIALGDTYYGGTLDVTTGVLTVTYGQVDLGNLTYGPNTNNRFIANVDNLYSSPDNNTLPYAIISSNKYLPRTGNTYVNADYTFYIQTNGTLAIRDIDYSNATDLKNSLNGVYLVYALATPIVIDLGSGTAVTARAGEVNNVFADCGQTELKYLTIEV